MRTYSYTFCIWCGYCSSTGRGAYTAWWVNDVAHTISMSVFQLDGTNYSRIVVLN